MNPKVSIIVPCYNYARYLRSALDSLLAQDAVDWECILIDNGSSDDTVVICKEYVKNDPRFIFISTENRGPSAARNQGLTLSKGKYIQFLDSDDMLERKKISFQSFHLDNNPDVDLVYGDVRYFTDLEPESRSFSMKSPDYDWMPKISGKGSDLIQCLLKYNIMTIHAPLFRKSILATTGIFDEKLKGFEDWDLWLRMALHNFSFKYVDASDTISLVRSHPVSLNKDQLTMRKDLLVVWWKCLKSGKLNLKFWPYVFLRLEEEFFVSIINAFKRGNSSLIGIDNINVLFQAILIIMLPLAIPFIILIRLYRVIRN